MTSSVRRSLAQNRRLLSMESLLIIYTYENIALGIRACSKCHIFSPGNKNVWRQIQTQPCLREGRYRGGWRRQVAHLYVNNTAKGAKIHQARERIGGEGLPFLYSVFLMLLGEKGGMKEGDLSCCSKLKKIYDALPNEIQISSTK